MSQNSGCQINKCGLQGAFTGSSEMTKNGSTRVLEDNHLDALEMEAGSFEAVPQSGSYSSYASSGRGSMGPANGRLSVCHPPPSLTTSPETIEEGQERRHDEGPHRRKASVDENYEWDAADFCSQPDNHDGTLPSPDLLKPEQRSHLPSMQASPDMLRNCARLSPLPGHRSGRPAGPEPEAVLF